MEMVLDLTSTLFSLLFQCYMPFYVQDTASSTEALNHLQGTKLYSSPPGEGMRLEYPSKAIVVCLVLFLFCFP